MNQSEGLSSIYERGRVCLDAGIPPDAELLGSMLECIKNQLDSSQRRECRDHYIRLAALQLQGGEWNKAELLLLHARALRRRRSTAAGTVDDCLRMAQGMMSLPDSDRQFYRIIRGKAPN